MNNFQITFSVRAGPFGCTQESLFEEQAGKFRDDGSPVRAELVEAATGERLFLTKS